MASLPRLALPLAPVDWDRLADPGAWTWDQIPALPPFTLADGSRPAGQATRARVCCDSLALYVRFDCEDRDIWWTYTERDQPLYDEEVVEVFLSPGPEDPIRYYEFEISPGGVVLDARIYNPTWERAHLEVHTGWDCAGLRWQAGCDGGAGHWWAVLVIPWAAASPAGELPAIWRANFCRIERPRDGDPEFSCWSPTYTEPADFHKPACFGFLEPGRMA